MTFKIKWQKNKETGKWSISLTAARIDHCSTSRSAACLPIVMGTSFTFFPTASAIGAASGIGVVLGGCLAGSLAEVIMGFFYKYIKRFFPPLVVGCILVTIDVNLLDVGIVAMTKVVNKWCIATGALILMISGFLPKLGAIFAAIPNAVLGGAIITVFGMILINGIKMIGKAKEAMIG